MIKTQNLTFSYKTGKEMLRFPDIDLSSDEHLLILGKSGIGKTTLLHLLAGLLKPIDGSIHINDTQINSLSSNKLDHFRGQHIGLVFQKNYAIQSLSIIENLKSRLFFSSKSIDNTAIDSLLNNLGLVEYQYNKPRELSEGQLQRLGIAMAVVHRPKVILADEPTSSLDDENCNKVIELLKKQAKNNNANLIVITHDQRVKSFFQNSITL